MDAHNVLNDLMSCRRPDGSGGKGQFNNGGYCNPKVDDLAAKVLVEVDTAKARRHDPRGLQDPA